MPTSNPAPPEREQLLPYARHWIDDDDIAAVVQVLRSDYLTCGPAVEQFERKIAEYVDAAYAVSFSNGTAALHAACHAAGIGLADQVITTPMTFAASANCILYQGGIPVFADIDERTYNLDPESVEREITEDTKAIIPVDFTGQPADLDSILELARKRGIIVIEDAAHALGAEYKGQKVGGISDMTMFSFHPAKLITSGEGGVITTNNKTYYERLLQFRTHGITRDASSWNKAGSRWYYEMQFLGYNYRLSDLQAALAISQMDKLENFIARRKHIASKYNEAFAECPQLQLPYQAQAGVSSWHLYIIQLRLEQLSGTRDDIYEALLHENIGVNVHYIPVYLHPHYQKLGYPERICPKAERIYERMITLPLFPAMSEQDVDDVIRSVRRIMERYSI
ncbi:UDP-4-amino-4,6-dideoxy-N-acetyl-beta-L-altrosamine transaminase [Paenibacillus sp. J2TS4]|uniref:UDP-4-amino-4, 6-dideoxy-N-acetyl-beta-L-altrosamine transaminase n=1 Tax=Paenibacillus sp. J2TS4 TaxID=2807194 RepID=UPI001AFE725D|nr:UDP-4-amino-4,6-dideoxy-N-acetyl-beta-L-altrosamine transaminase [Paenibacillus sp. J2TS4]GIP36211.1 UDP-4-amino-4,6-dideoxy-N-acetyl-beta-L-altrosami ne transaminase [Paenibacillus sp. J2TS4]